MRADQPRVVVTGLGATSPVGGDVATTWASLLAGRSGARRLPDDWAPDLPVQIAAPGAQSITFTSSIAFTQASNWLTLQPASGSIAAN